jgi:hypothetical protein
MWAERAAFVPGTARARTTRRLHSEIIRDTLRAKRCSVSARSGPERRDKEKQRVPGAGVSLAERLVRRPTPPVISAMHRAAENSFRPPNDIEFSGERKRVRCKDEVDSSFMT